MPRDEVKGNTMRAQMPMYEGDGLFHDAPRSVQATAVRPARADAAPRAVAARRAEAMRRFFPKLASWFADQFDNARMRAVERYLSQATDLCDLEQRIRRLERDMGCGSGIC
jgi:CRP-like cAMP-binding protein